MTNMPAKLREEAQEERACGRPTRPRASRAKFNELLERLLQCLRNRKRYDVDAFIDQCLAFCWCSNAPNRSFRSFAVMHAPCLFRESIANVDGIRDDLAHEFRNLCLYLCANIGLWRLRSRQAQTWSGWKPADRFAFAYRTADLRLTRLRIEIIFRREPAFETMVVLATEVIDFHGRTAEECDEKGREH